MMMFWKGLGGGCRGVLVAESVRMSCWLSDTGSVGDRWGACVWFM